MVDKDWIALPEYTIADISAYGRVRGWKNAGVQIDDTPRLKDWLERVEARPAVKRVDGIINDYNAKLRGDVAPDQHSILYGERQFQRK